jgi:uncharacterized radical SAM superfamily protein
VSVTGRQCALNCLHCGGNYLEGRLSVGDDIPEASSYLITGGCDADGRVPICEHLDDLRSLPEDSTKIAHTGLVDENEAEELSNLIDVASFDFVGDDRTIRTVYGLHKSVDDYADSYSSISNHIPTFPHLTIGLYKGELAGEFEVLNVLRDLGTEDIVLNVFMPTEGTPLGNLPPPALGDVGKVMREARESFKGVFIGCMRPGGRYREELDLLAVEEGVDRIVNPSKPSRELAVAKGLEVEWREECCIL